LVWSSTAAAEGASETLRTVRGENCWNTDNWLFIMISRLNYYIIISQLHVSRVVPVR